MPRGFASLSKAARKHLSKKGGKAVQEKGKGHSYSVLEATAAAAKSTLVRRKKFALIAAARLIKSGIAVEDLGKLGLSIDEFIYYGGSRANNERLQELTTRIAGM